MKDPVVRERVEPPSLPPVETGLAAVLARPDFRRLWIGQIGRAHV